MTASDLGNFLPESDIWEVEVTNVSNPYEIHVRFTDTNAFEKLSQDLEGFYRGQNRPRLLNPRVSDLAVFIRDSLIRRIEFLSDEPSDDGNDDHPKRI